MLKFEPKPDSKLESGTCHERTVVTLDFRYTSETLIHIRVYYGTHVSVIMPLTVSVRGANMTPILQVEIQLCHTQQNRQQKG